MNNGNLLYHSKMDCIKHFNGLNRDLMMLLHCLMKKKVLTGSEI